MSPGAKEMFCAGKASVLPLPSGEGWGEGAHDGQLRSAHALTPNPSPNGRGGLPTGVIVGTAIVSRCERAPHNGLYCWHLANVERIARPRKPKRQPQPVWFRPF